MKKRISILIALMLAVTLCIDTAAVSASELSDLNKKIKDKKASLEQGKKKEKEMMDSIVDLEETISQLDGEIGNAQEDLAVLTEELEKAKKKVRRQNKDLSKRLRSMYKNGSVGFLDVLLSSGSFSDFLTNLDMVQRILKNDEDVLEDLKEAHQLIKKKKKEVEELQAELEAAQQTAVAEKADVTRQKEELEAANKREADDIGDLEAEREALEARLAAEAEQGKISNSKNSKYKEGQFLWPLPASHEVTSEYGWRDCPFHGREFHAAIDIGGADPGSPIVASASGKVVQAGWYGGFGISVIIDHGGGLTTQYNHCSSVNVSEGDKVKRGQTIAFLGSTGYSTGPHLDYRVYKDGNVVSPWDYL
ncbi:MAG: peptidoglycan DD-metalloendopeptidase family protein [Firmicutes bacterium]|nr:peptidoglycan DD-metalloendopeptidase family protein [Bacillota bacterium]